MLDELKRKISEIAEQIQEDKEVKEQKIKLYKITYDTYIPALTVEEAIEAFIKYIYTPEGVTDIHANFTTEISEEDYEE